MHKAVSLLPLLPLLWHSRESFKVGPRCKKGQVAVDSLPGLSLHYSADCNLPTSSLLFMYFLTEYSAPLSTYGFQVSVLCGVCECFDDDLRSLSNLDGVESGAPLKQVEFRCKRRELSGARGENYSGGRASRLRSVEFPAHTDSAAPLRTALSLISLSLPLPPPPTPRSLLATSPPRSCRPLALCICHLNSPRPCMLFNWLILTP